MPGHAVHLEHRQRGFKLAEVILGGQDGLVNVLGVILGVAAASNSRSLVIAAGMAATFAESISMAAVAYTSSVAEADHYRAERNRERQEIERLPELEREEIAAIYRRKGFRGAFLEKIVDTITENKAIWLKTMMEEELKLEPTSRRDSLKSSVIVGVSALAGSFIPLIPFFLFGASTGIVPSLALSALTLFLIGVYKAKHTIGRPIRTGMEMLVIGMLSALAGYLIGLLFSSRRQ
ncbi:MAG: VIT1/CCC1 transporter family protein [Candidatus Kerfeldbacteria bacterium]|nr:VIT1/CCC1 transporter family protein [Candidatus Kerfeldbacteria bacterium]